MSGRDKFGGPPGAVRSFMEKLKRTVSDAVSKHSSYIRFTNTLDYSDLEKK